MPADRDRPAYNEGRDALVDAAARVIARDGFRGLTYRAVAREANVTHGLVSYHFGSRDVLVREALGRVAETAIDDASIVPSSGRLEDLARDLITVARESPDAQAAQFELTLEARRRPELLPAVEAFHDRYVDAVARALERAGVASDRATARMVFAALDGLMLQQLVLGNTDDTGAALDALRALLAQLPVATPNERSDPLITGGNGRSAIDLHRPASDSSRAAAGRQPPL